MNLSTKLSIPIICINILLIIAVYFSANSQIQGKLTTDYTDNLREMSNHMADEIYSLQISASNACEWFQESARIISSIKDNNLTSIQDLSETATSAFGLDLFMVIREDGTVFFNNLHPELTGTNYADEFTPFQTAIGGDIYSDFFISGDNVYVCATSPVIDTAGKAIATVTLGYNLSSESFVDDYKKMIDHDITIFIGITRSMTTLLNDSNERIIGTDLTDESLIQEVTVHNNQYIGQTQIQGKQYICGYTPILNKDGDLIILFLGKNITSVEEMALSISGTLVSLVIAITIISVLLILFFIILLIRRPMKKLMHTMNRIKPPDSDNCDLTLRIDNHSRDEIGRIALQFNMLLDEIQTIVVNITNVSETLAASSETLAASSEETSAMTIMVNDSMTNIHEDARKQNVETSTGVNLMDILSDNISDIMRNALDMDSSSKDTTMVTKNGLDAVKLLEKTSEENSSVVREMSEKVSELNEKSKEIDTILTVITTIAEQTNLLALNASIEAARAGDSGRGFAVVAGEVGNLAVQSNQSTQEIQTLVSDVQNGIAVIARLMQQVSSLISRQTEAVNNTKSSFSNIDHSVSEIALVIHSVTDALSVMESNKEGIAAVIASVSDVASETSEATNSVTSSVQSITEAIESIAELAQELSNVSIELKENIQVFQI